MAVEYSIFSDDRRQFDRYFGGNVNGQEPYITGYIFMKFILPSDFENFLSPIDGKLTSKTLAEQILGQTCLSVQTPSETVNKTTFIGAMNRKWSVPTSTDISDNISVRHTEFSGTPLMNIYESWVHMMRDQRYGVQLNKSYKGKLLVVSTNPSLEIERAYLYTGIFPMKNLSDALSGDISTNDKLELDVDYNVDVVYSGTEYPFVMDSQKAFLNAISPNGTNSPKFDVANDGTKLANVDSSNDKLINADKI